MNFQQHEAGKMDLKLLEKYVSVEYPCFVSTINKAVDMINGEYVFENLVKSSSHIPAVKLNFHDRSNLNENLLPPNVDMLRSSLTSRYSNKESCVSSLVIRLRRKRRSVPGENTSNKKPSGNSYPSVGLTKMDVIGKITEIYDFPYPADIQVRVIFLWCGIVRLFVIAFTIIVCIIA